MSPNASEAYGFTHEECLAGRIASFQLPPTPDWQKTSWILDLNPSMAETHQHGLGRASADSPQALCGSRQMMGGRVCCVHSTVTTLSLHLEVPLPDSFMSPSRGLPGSRGLTDWCTEVCPVGLFGDLDGWEIRCDQAGEGVSQVALPKAETSVTSPRQQHSHQDGLLGASYTSLAGSSVRRACGV